MITWTPEEMHALEDAITEADYGLVRLLQVLYGDEKFNAMVQAMNSDMRNYLRDLIRMAHETKVERRTSVAALMAGVGAVTVLAFVAYRTWM